MKRVLSIGAAVLFVFGAGACGSSEPRQPVTGSIVEVEHEPAKAGKHKKDCNKRKVGNQPCTEGGKSERFLVDVDVNGDGEEDYDDIEINRAEYDRLRATPNGGVGQPFTVR